MGPIRGLHGEGLGGWWGGACPRGGGCLIWTTNTGYGTTNTDAGVGIGMEWEFKKGECWGGDGCRGLKRGNQKFNKKRLLISAEGHQLAESNINQSKIILIIIPMY